MASPWNPELQLPAVPLNQIRSLPTAAAEQSYISKDGADTISYASHSLKYWSPAVLGFSALHPVGGAGSFRMSTAFLDLDPCQFYVLTLLRNIPLGDAGAASGNLYGYFRYKQTPADLPPVVDTGLAYGSLFLTNAFNFPALAGAATQRYSMTISPDNYQLAAHGATLLIGPSFSFTFWSGTAPAGGDNSSYSLSIYGSTN
jgi:hypothetical protein